MALIGTLSVVGQLVIQSTLQSQLGASEVINIAGRQRMLSQRIAKQVLILRDAQRPRAYAATLKDLHDDRRTWVDAHRALSTGELSTAAPRTPEADAKLAEAGRLLQSMATVAREASDVPFSERTAITPLADRLLDLEVQYLPAMNDVVFAYSTQAEASLRRTRRIELGLGITTVLVLIGEVLLIFGPLLRAVRASWKRRDEVAADLESSEARFARAVAGANEGLWDWNTDTGELHWSPRFREMADVPEGAVASWTLFSKSVVEVDRALLTPLVDADVPPDSIAIEVRVRTPSGPRWVALEGRVPEGSPTYVSGSLTDIDERRALRAERERLLRSKDAALHATREDLMRARLMNAVGSLAGGIAHELNNALNVITLGAGMLEKRGSDDELLASMRGATDQAASLARQLLALRDGPGQSVLEPMDVGAALRAARPIFEGLLPPSIALQLQLPASLPRVEADASQLQQALVNLVLNARDAMPEGGTLRIEASTTDAETKGIEIAVVDDGCGMPEETRARMFEPFFTTKHKSAGAGLGLPMVDGIVRQHGGRVRVVSAEGAGTTVFVWLPATERTPDVVDEVQARSLTVLLVDDEPMIRKVAARVFSVAGHTVVPAESAEEALVLLEDPELRYDVIVTDVVMPGMHGPELVERTREILGGAFPVLFMSGFTPDDLPRGPCTAFLPKPFSPRGLLDAVKKLVKSEHSEN